jgi:hypothetical protein
MCCVPSSPDKPEPQKCILATEGTEHAEEKEKLFLKIVNPLPVASVFPVADCSFHFEQDLIPERPQKLPLRFQEGQMTHGLFQCKKAQPFFIPSLTKISANSTAMTRRITVSTLQLIRSPPFCSIDRPINCTA